MKQKNQPLNMVLPILLIVLSLATTLSNFQLLNIPQLIVSVIGIWAGIFFFLKIRASQVLLFIWVFAQIVAVSHSVSYVSPHGVTIITKYIVFDATQTLTAGITLSAGSNEGGRAIFINLLPFAFLALLKYIQLQDLPGREVVIGRYKPEGNLNDYFPIKGKYIRTAIVGHEKKKWALIECYNDLEYEGIAFRFLLARSIDNVIFKPRKKPFVSFLRQVEDPETVLDTMSNVDDYKSIDWGRVKIGKK